MIPLPPPPPLVILLIAVNVAMWVASVGRRAGRTIPEVHHWTEME